MEYLAVLTGIFCGMFYLFLGVGVARLFLKTEGKFSSLVLIFWPIALCVYAAAGEIHLG